MPAPPAPPVAVRWPVSFFSSVFSEPSSFFLSWMMSWLRGFPFSMPAWPSPLTRVLLPSSSSTTEPLFTPLRVRAALPSFDASMETSRRVTLAETEELWAFTVTVLSVVLISWVSLSLVVTITLSSARSLISPFSSETYPPEPSVCVTVCWFLALTLMLRSPLVRS